MWKEMSISGYFQIQVQREEDNINTIYMKSDSDQTSKKWWKCKIASSQSLAWVTWTLLANNPVSLTFYLLLSLIDFIISLTYSFILTQRLHLQNLKEISGQSDYNHSGDSQGLSMQFLKGLDDTLTEISNYQSEALFTISAFLLGLMAFILLAIFVLMPLLMKTHVGLEKPMYWKKAFSFLLVSLLTYLNQPIFDILCRNIYSTLKIKEYSMTQISIPCAISTLAILCFVVIMVFLSRVFIILVPTELVPWCGPTSKIIYVNLIIRVLQVLFVVIDQSGSYILIEVVVLFLLYLFQSCYRLLFAPQFLKQVDQFQKTRDFSQTLVFFIGLICKIVGDVSNYDLMYFIIFLPVVTIGWVLYEKYRKQTILTKIKRKTLKLEIEFEFSLYVMMTLVRDCTQQTGDSQLNQIIFGQLMDLTMTHIEDCDDQLCICDEMENFYELLRLRQLQNQEVFPLLKAERKKYKKIIDDQGLIGTISNLTDMILRTSNSQSSESTVLQNNNEQDRLDLQDENDENQAKKDQQPGGQRQPQVVKKKTRATYKINIDEVKFRFLSELLYLFYYEMKSKFPDSFKIQLLSNYFALAYKKKEMLCIFQMRSFNKEKCGKIDQICVIANEQYLLNEIAKYQKLQSTQQTQDGNFNGDYFIQINQLYSKFNVSIENLSALLSSFWRNLALPQLEVDSTQEMGQEIARKIRSVHEIFVKLDEVKALGGSKDYQMYFQFAVVQLHILNDPVAYELYIGKMKSILEINKIYQKNFSSQGKSSDYSNFIIVNANGAKFGQILQVNNTLRQMLGWQEEEFRNFRIEHFMPTLIKNKHHEFMERYNKTGQSYIIDNKVTMFIKKANSYVIPVELYIKFHYSVEYQYIFLAILTPLYEIAPFNNGVKYNLNQVAFILTDNEDGIITEYSESCKTLLGIDETTLFDCGAGIIKRIGEFVIDLDFAKVKKTRQQRYIDNSVYEKEHKIDVKYFKDSHISDIFGKNHVDIKDTQFENVQYAKIRMFEERYSGGVLDMNIFCIHIIDENDKSISLLHSNYGSVISRNPIGPQVIGNNTNQPLTDIHEEDHEDGKSQDASSSVTGSLSSSLASSTTSMAEFRNFHSFSHQNTPKSLKLIIQLILALYLVMMAVASVNLAINYTRQLQSESDVLTVREAFDRMNWVSMNQLLVRVLLNIANGYETDDTLLIKDRFNAYKQLQADRIIQLKSTQSELEQTGFTISETFKEFIEGKNVDLYYLSDQNKQYIKKESLNLGLNLYITKLTEMNAMNLTQMRGRQRFMSLNYSDNYYVPTFQEQSLFFIVENGNRDLRLYAINSSSSFARESQEHAEQNILQTKITAIISIVTILVIGLIISPIMTKAEMRKYRALTYFLMIPKDKLPQMIKNCEYCLNMNNEQRYNQIQKDYEGYLGIKLINQQADQLRQARQERTNISNQNERNSQGMQQSDYGITETNSYQDNSSIGSRFQKGSIASGNNSSQARKQMKKIQMLKTDPQTVKEENNEDEVDNDNQELENDTDDQKTKLESQKNENQNRLDVASLNMRQNKHNVKNEDDLPESPDENHEVSDKIKSIGLKANRRRNIVILLQLVVILFLSMYFVIAYFMAMDTFQTAAKVIDTLEIIFYKGSCFDSAMNFLREEIIRNQSLLLTPNLSNQTATEYYIDYCYQKEADYNDMRVNLPSYLKEAAYFINQIEMPQMCDYVYTGEYAHLRSQCAQGLNGLLQTHGLTNGFYFMFTQILKQDLEFKQKLHDGRSAEELKKMLSNEQILQIIDLKALILDPTLNRLKQLSMMSVISHMKSLMESFLTSYVVFAVLLTICTLILVCIGFRILRQSMWDTNVILKVIPFETLPKKERIEIKDFFNS